jgi:hypothetical protein
LNPGLDSPGRLTPLTKINFSCKTSKQAINLISLLRWKYVFSGKIKKCFDQQYLNDLFSKADLQFLQVAQGNENLAS